MKLHTVGILGFFLFLSPACTNTTRKSDKALAPANQPLEFRNITAKRLEQQCKHKLGEARQALDRILSLKKGEHTVANTLVAIDDIGNDLWRFGNKVYLVANVHPDSKLRKTATEVVNRLEKFDNAMYFNRKLYLAVRNFADSKQGKTLQGEYARAVRELLLDFRRNGMHLAAEKVERLRTIKEKLNRLTIRFSRNIAADDTVLILPKEKLRGLPNEYLEARKTKDGRYRIDLSYPSLIPFLEYAEDDQARKQLLTRYLNRAREKNLPLLAQVLRLRSRFVTLLGYTNYAQYVLSRRMAKRPGKVWHFLKDLQQRLEPYARKDLTLLQRFKRKRLGKQKLEPVIHRWEIAFYSNLARKQLFSLDQNEIRQYFSVPDTIQGLFAVSQRLFSLRYRRVENPDVWHKDVELYEVFDRTSGRLLGRFYLDLYPRKGKYQHAAMFTLIQGKQRAGYYQLPTFALVCNFPRPHKGKPGLLRHSFVVTFFHEFGHGLHCLLTKARLSMFAGTAVARDFVEMPSQMFENWAFEPKVLALFARHYQTRAPIPDRLVSRINKARRFLSGYNNLVQVFYALYDMTLHTGFQPAAGKTTTTLYNSMRERITGVPSVPGTAPEASFGHLMGYAAGYYGYLWARVYAEDLFQVFRKQGLFNRDLGRRYRRQILSRGGTEDPVVLLRRFLGRKPGSAAFIRSLGLK